MAELEMLARAPLAGHLQPGRHGRAEGAPGLRLSERAGLAAAAVSLRAGQGEVLAAALREGFGLDL
ncbi:hypothetical protein, partial [Falsiroseomonas oryzae]|uniref:hypothetical protein n=1 Tax=Falsiroseomonas oryzae TaxID=2766473 RepID=UPI0022EBA3D6